MFAGSNEGAKRAAILHTLISSAANCGHNPFEYLRVVLQCVPDQPLSCLDKLLPPIGCR
ncbi:MAG: transposase domain-containing protein [Lewinellaceae bacterium]|nr:transposase domain-containing protein [Saprospiraceae bacterium]MCB9336795.1 transposase domain-containing protein [Lewinellaceae bacterium]